MSVKQQEAGRPCAVLELLAVVQYRMARHLVAEAAGPTGAATVQLFVTTVSRMRGKTNAKKSTVLKLRGIEYK